MVLGLSSQHSYPSTLALISLHDHRILLPGVVSRLVLRTRASAQLIKQLSGGKEGRSNSTFYMGCAPVLSKKDVNGQITDGREQENSNSLTPPPTPTEVKGSSPAAVSDTIIRQTQIEELESVQGADNERLYVYGCCARIIRVERLGFGGFAMFVEGVSRFRIESVLQHHPYTVARVNYVPDNSSAALIGSPNLATTNPDLYSAIVAFRSVAREFLGKMKELSLPEPLTVQLTKLVESSSPDTLSYILTTVIETSFEEKLAMLREEKLERRLEMASDWITRQMHVLKISSEIQSTVQDKLSKKQREFYLRQQLAAIKEELGESNKDDDPLLGASGGATTTDEDEIRQLSQRLKDANLPEEASAAAQKELKRLKRLHPTTAEWSVVRNYLELVADLPWSKGSQDILDVARARRILREDHYGLEKVKRRIIEYISVIKVKGDLKAPIICFVGPPGVGKTSLGKSIATALNREFHRISLGGVRDEADIRGHRRTYVGALPGCIIHGMKKVGVNNPVILLDEIDKTVNSSNHYGDPSAALLEVLDPEQNNTFVDHCLNIPFDLSKVVFIATANTTDTIPAPLLDRMEMIYLPGYTFEEKLSIARKYLLPKQEKAHGLLPGSVQMSDEVILRIAERYTRESGVRTLERHIAAVVRAKCVELADKREEAGVKSEPTAEEMRCTVDLGDLEGILGIEPYSAEVASRKSSPGLVTGLAYTASGSGGVLFIEATQMPGKGDLKLTGKLGDVIKESAQIALSWVKSHAYKLGLVAYERGVLLDGVDVHIHLPEGATPKDGPSAGIALITALVSLFSQRLVPTTTAMTGEITLRGQVLPVGGIKEKVISAHRAGITRVIMPERNRKDVEGDVPEKARQDMEFVYVKEVGEVLQHVFGDKLSWQLGVEARL
ncbi:hypothetical protein BZG36_03853 [Bifiguratus adelaidae]|uniref:Lon protease homolog n=1 Tax=Bifiguratus adelaidae TaxID=1938954 RepID=A0A261XWK9_9FUNG|nr:hypothetical protein BZG36_03853 [Bifiguratus adelaidae]